MNLTASFLVLTLSLLAHAGEAPDPRYPMLPGSTPVALPDDSFSACGGGQMGHYAVQVSSTHTAAELSAAVRTKAEQIGWPCSKIVQNQCTGRDWDLMWGVSGGKKNPANAAELLYVVCYSKVVGE